MIKVIVRQVADTALVAALLFLSAGTIDWPRAWSLLATMFLIRSVGAVAVYRANPALMRERAALPVHRQQSSTDRVLLLSVLATGFLGLPIVAGLDVFHWRLLPRPDSLLAATGLALFALGWVLKSLALRANAFAVTVVRLQNERAHAVADSGPYAVVRHPFYAADPLIHAGLALWLQSYVALIAAAVPIALMVTRLVLEERFLQRELPGYGAYAKRVRFRLIPGLW